MPVLRKLLENYKNKRFYHTSGFKYNHGDIIGGPGKKVFLHDNYLPHWSIIDIIKNGFRSYEEYIDNYQKQMKKDLPMRDLDFKNHKFKKTWVYEVKPFNIKNVKYRSINQEYITEDFVEIIKNVGSAFGILTKYFNRKE